MWVVRYGMSDLKGILRSAKKKDYVMYVVYLVESSIARVNSDLKKYKRSPDAIVQSTIIFDMEGFSMQHITNKQGKKSHLNYVNKRKKEEKRKIRISFSFSAMDSAIKIIQVYEANYPELLYRVFIVNGTFVMSNE